MTSIWVTGLHPVEELLASRTQVPRQLLVSQSVPEAVRERLSGLARSAGIPCRICPREEWRRRTGEREGRGVGAEIASFRYAAFPEWVDTLPKRSFAFLLDGITDPQNLGAILRNARAFGASGILLPKDRSCPVTSAVFRASAGAAAHLPVIQVTNLVRAMEAMKEKGFWIFAAAGDGDVELADWDPAARSGVVLGSEEGGIRKRVREHCDAAVRIGMEPGTESLNVSVASGIFGYVLRKSLTSGIDSDQT
ncbi:MAG: 23S rRNA (guanosine(2251)-2'-O)-methyltransferase RlmB [Deltaproteobacteria bacterium]